MSHDISYSLFRKGKTLYFSSLFFEPAVRDDVATLYAFAELVDRETPNTDLFYRCWEMLDTFWGSDAAPQVTARLLGVSIAGSHSTCSIRAWL